jgi:hypothetical protein
MLVNEADHVGQGRSSSLAIGALASLRTSFTLRSSAFKRRQALVLLGDVGRDAGALA